MPTVFAFLPDAAEFEGTLSVKLYDLTPGTVLNGAEGDELVADEAKPGWYAATVTETIAGMKRAVLLLDGETVSESLIDMSATPPVVGVGSGEVTGFTASAAVDLAALIAANAGELAGTVNFPRVAKGKVLQLIVGDDYLESIGTAIPWSLSNAGHLPDFSTGWTVSAHVRNDVLSSSVEFVGVIVAGSGATRSGFLEADQEATAALKTGAGKYQLVFTETATGKQTTPLQGLTQTDRRTAV